MPAPFGPPFDHADGDLVLRSSDDIDFVIHRLVLSLSSPFFRDLPYDISTERERGLPVIPLVEEDHETVERLLRIVYPGVDRPSLARLSREETRALFEAARKYEFDSVFVYAERISRLPGHIGFRLHVEHFAPKYAGRDNAPMRTVVEDRAKEAHVALTLAGLAAAGLILVRFNPAALAFCRCADTWIVQFRKLVV
jgi:hypothetical protein